MGIRNIIQIFGLILWISSFCFALPSQAIPTFIRYDKSPSAPITYTYDATVSEPEPVPTSDSSSITVTSPKQDQHRLKRTASTPTTAPNLQPPSKTQPTDFKGLILLIALTPLIALPRKPNLQSRLRTYSEANGNISEYIDLSDGSIEAHLEYDAFGRTIASTGTAPAPFGFSTKYLDEESGYYYYGFRYYDPETGRWPNRDPIEERGGYNVYGFVGNSAVIRWDYLGRQYTIELDGPAKILHPSQNDPLPKAKFKYSQKWKLGGVGADDNLAGYIIQKMKIIVTAEECFPKKEENISIPGFDDSPALDPFPEITYEYLEAFAVLQDAVLDDTDNWSVDLTKLWGGKFKCSTGKATFSGEAIYYKGYDIDPKANLWKLVGPLAQHPAQELYYIDFPLPNNMNWPLPGASSQTLKRDLTVTWDACGCCGEKDGEVIWKHESN